MSSVLEDMSVWRASENALESALTLAVAATAWGVVWDFCATPHVGRGMTEVEQVLILGGAASMSAWVVSLHLHMMGWRRPRFIAFWSTAFGLLALWSTKTFALFTFGGRCAELGGEITRGARLVDGAEIDPVCVMGAVTGSPYLPGTLLEPGFDGQISAWIWLTLAGFCVLSSLGYRDLRLRPTRIGARLLGRLALAPGAGAASALGALQPDDDVMACANPTLWGEPCGQLYPVSRDMAEGAWCARCKQPFTAAERRLRLDVVTLVTADIDVLNGWERMDSLSWPRGKPRPVEGRVSGQARWVRLGTVELPEVMSVAQALSLVHERLEGWTGLEDPTLARAARVARDRASRICAWLWFGAVGDRLTYARPTTRVRFALGATRLRDLVPDAGETLTLQLDVGLLPLELRYGFHKSFLDGRADEVRNTRTDLWVPVSPPPERQGQAGVWVDRIEGAALRAWLATDRVRTDEARGVSTPLAYTLDPAAPTRPSGRLDYRRLPLDPAVDEPGASPLKGTSVSEWEWFEGEQIELFRQEALVLVDTGATRPAPVEA